MGEAVKQKCSDGAAVACAAAGKKLKIGADHVRCAAVACTKPDDEVKCCMDKAAGQKCSITVASATDFCPAGKVYDLAKAEHACIGAACNKAVSDDVDACCKATADEEVTGSMTFTNLNLATAEAKNEFETAVQSAVSSSLGVAKAWIKVTISTSRRLDARRLAEVNVQYVITIPSDQISTGLSGASVKDGIVALKAGAAKTQFVGDLNTGLKTPVSANDLTVVDPTVKTKTQATAKPSTSSTTASTTAKNSTEDDPSNAMRETAITAVLVTIGLN